MMGDFSIIFFQYLVEFIKKWEVRESKLRLPWILDTFAKRNGHLETF